MNAAFEGPAQRPAETCVFALAAEKPDGSVPDVITPIRAERIVDPVPSNMRKVLIVAANNEAVVARRPSTASRHS